MDNLWAGWRSSYVTGLVHGEVSSDTSGDGQSVFERILSARADDEEGFIVHRGALCSAILNIYPYNPGHLMVLPNRAVTDLEGLSDDEHTDLWRLVRDGVVAVRAAFDPDGVNVGVNLGSAAGAGVPGHLHVHVVPRWAANTNFMTSVATTRVLPVSLDQTWERLPRRVAGRLSSGPQVVSKSDQSSGLSSTNQPTTSPRWPSTSTRPRRSGGFSWE